MWHVAHSLDPTLGGQGRASATGAVESQDLACLGTLQGAFQGARLHTTRGLASLHGNPGRVTLNYDRSWFYADPEIPSRH